eukprot:scaffold124780_cov58-Phaeocystis_antarctica.AAC.3
MEKPNARHILNCMSLRQPVTVPPLQATPAVERPGDTPQRPTRRAQLRPLERRRAGHYRRAAAKVRRPVDLNRHLARAVQDHNVEAVALVGADLLSRGQPQCQQRRDHVELQLRGHVVLAAEGVAAALGKLGRQRRPGGASLLPPQLPLVQLAQVLRNKAALRRTQLHEGIAVEEGRRDVVGSGERPRRVGECLRREVAQPRRRLRGDRSRSRSTAAVAIASSSAGAARPAVANAHAMLARCCGVKSRSRSAAAVAIASSSAGAAQPAVANAHAVFARSCGLKSRSRSTASVATASSSAGALWSAVANAHAVLARSCGLKSRSRGIAAAAIASSSAGVARPAVANAHAVLARACGSNSRSRGTVSVAIASSSAGALWPPVANAHTMSASSCGLNSCSRSTAAAAIASNSVPASTSNPTSLHLARPCAIFDRFLASHDSSSSMERRSSSRTSSLCLGADASLCFPSVFHRFDARMQSSSCVLPAFEIRPLIPLTAPLGASGARPRACEDGVPSRRSRSRLLHPPRCMTQTAAAPTVCVDLGETDARRLMFDVCAESAREFFCQRW